VISSGPGGVVFLVKLAEFGGSLQRDADCAAKQRVKGFYPKYLAREYPPEVARDGFSDCI
jgi:hypothetical protein